MTTDSSVTPVDLPESFPFAAPGLPQLQWRGALFAALFETLSHTDQAWVRERIQHYLRLNVEEHIEARL